MTRGGEAGGARAVIGLGTNLGSREALLRAAVDLLAAAPGLAVVGCSRVVQTSPLGPPQPDYLNAAVLARTRLAPEALLAAVRAVEQRLGRERRERWSARTLDADVLWIEDTAVESDALTVPHAELARRAFALGPLVELVPEAREPRTGRAYAALLAALDPAAAGGAVGAPAPLGEGFGGVRAADGGFELEARDRADALAAAAEALAARAAAPARVAPTHALPLEVAAPGGRGARFADDAARLGAWLAAVRARCDAPGFAVRRAVVFEDEPGRVRGALLGEPLDPARHAAAGACGACRVERAGAGADGRYRARVALEAP